MFKITVVAPPAVNGKPPTADNGKQGRRSPKDAHLCDVMNRKCEETSLDNISAMAEHDMRTKDSFLKTNGVPEVGCQQHVGRVRPLYSKALQTERWRGRRTASAEQEGRLAMRLPANAGAKVFSTGYAPCLPAGSRGNPKGTRRSDHEAKARGAGGRVRTVRFRRASRLHTALPREGTAL
ncbi:hypothetical protein SKAU_G00365810 [Synaphobranchus kaupii]|uniref:Uncharacterized protein n=1 Tax=Synaphobranchus kaupii TaxID=118154 RepID=A0A9Q1EF19_SYNKA|nr:hypothetical protein SKAU_G00365810 [Synaphobranchus kaupii]